MEAVIALDIGGTAIKYGIIDGEGRLQKKNAVPTRAHLGKGHIVSAVKDIVRACLKEGEAFGIAISTAGMVDTEKGEVFYAGETMPGYSRTPWKEILEEAFHLPCEVENDVNCAALAEAKMGSAKESRITLCLTVGTGIGASLLLDKKVYHGAGFCAMEAGYMYMDGSDFQSLASGGALCERVAKRKGGEKKEWNGRRIFSLAKAGDAVCTEEIRYTVDCLAKGIANLCYAVNPDCVVLGGGIMEQEAYLRPLLESSLKARLRPVLFSSLCLFFASFGNDAGMYGAYLHFLSRRERN